jgi:Fe-S cluster assembly iron-binding protein IscA
MLQLTKDATRHLIHVRQERGVDEDAGARFVSNGGRVGLTFAQAPSAGDLVVDGEGIRVFVAPDISQALEHSTIDAREVDGKRGLIMRKRATDEVRPS